MNEFGYIAIICGMIYIIMGIGTYKLTNDDLINPLVSAIFWPIALIVVAFIG